MNSLKIAICFFATLFLLNSCNMKEQVDFIGYNGVIYTVDSVFTKAEAFAIKEGKFVKVGTTADILAKYKVPTNNIKSYIDFNGAAVYPGLNDSHCHLYGLGMSLQNVSLRNAASFNEILERLQKAYNANPNRSLIKCFQIFL